MRRVITICASFGFVAAAGCSSGSGDHLSDESPELASQAMALTSLGAGRQLAWDLYLPYAAFARNAFTTASIGGGACSATMIGPNLVITAGHCLLPRNTTITFRMYQD